MPSVDRLHDRYDVDAEAFGKGAFGTVYQAVHKQTGDECAIKVLKKSSFSLDRQIAAANADHCARVGGTDWPSPDGTPQPRLLGGGGGLGGNVLRGLWAFPSGKPCYGSATGRYNTAWEMGCPAKFVFHNYLPRDVPLKVIGALRGSCCVVSVGAPRIPPPPSAMPSLWGGGGRQDIVCGAPPPAIAPNPRSLSGV